MRIQSHGRIVQSPLRILVAAAVCCHSIALVRAQRVTEPRGAISITAPSSPPVSLNPHAGAPPRISSNLGTPQTVTPQTATPELGPRRITPPGQTVAPAIPDEARALLPPGCLEAWEGPARKTVAQPISERRPVPSSDGPLGGGWKEGNLLRDDLLGENSLGNDLRGVDPLSSIGPAADDPLAPAPLSQLGPARPTEPNAAAANTAAGASAEDPHRALFLEDSYPSAMTCAKCHPQHYEQWRVSAHAYAIVSPMFQRFEQKMTELTQGTVGHFCMRCHAPVATQLQLPRHASVLDAPAVIREGITCIACHRVRESYSETNGGRRVEPGDIFQPVYGSSGGAGLRRAIAESERHKLKTDPADTGAGQPIHREGIFFEPLTRSDFCLSCHQVAVHPGIALEVVYSQYRAGPAAAKGITCQQCHMGTVPGKPNGYACAPIAELAGKPYGEPQKQSNHMFWGPGFSIAHPGIFPQHEKAQRWSPRQWLEFDWQQGWGTEEFERAFQLVEAAAHLPPPWDNADERRDARQVLDANLQSLALARSGSIATMEAGSEIAGPLMDSQPRAGEPLRFKYIVRNASEGHNLPSGSLGAQPQVWLNVALVAPDGRTVWESGYLDSQGDLADMHSEDVAHGRLPRDAQLFNLQTKFLITNLKGTEREVPLPVNFDLDPLPFLRPGAVPVSVLNHPPLIRMEAHSIPPLDSRAAHYRVPADRMRGRGLYRLDVRLRSRVEPAYFMRFVGMSPEEINRMNLQILDIHTRSYPFYVE